MLYNYKYHSYLITAPSLLVDSISFKLNNKTHREVNREYRARERFNPIEENKTLTHPETKTRGNTFQSSFGRLPVERAVPFFPSEASVVARIDIRDK